MAVENITLNLIPTGDKPSIHVAQFDVDRPFTITLKEGEDDFTPTDYTIELQVRKVDNNIVTSVPSETSGNVVTFNTTEQMTACSGTNLAELQLSKDDKTFATLHFYLVVQRDVLAGGVTSDSAIHNLTEQIAEIVPEVIGDDYYTAEEVDEKIAEIPTFDPTNYYDKSDVDALLNDKADISDLPDMSNYYDKSETDALLDDKADVSDLPDMTNYYTKSEVDTKITDLYQVKTASGDIVHITDGGNNIPVKSFECAIGSTGFSQANIVVCSKNLINASDLSFNANASQTAVLASNMYLPAGTYTLSFTVSNTAIVTRSRPLYLNLDTSTNVYASADITAQGRQSWTFTLDVGTNLSFRWWIVDNSVAISLTDFQLEKSSTSTTYEAYNGITYTVTFGSSFNDGVLKYENGAWYIDVSGVVTPITSTTRVKIISGENNIFSNTGTCEVDYFTETSDALAELIKAFM